MSTRRRIVILVLSLVTAYVWAHYFLGPVNTPVPSSSVEAVP